LQGWEAGAGEDGDHSDDDSSLNDAMEIEEEEAEAPEGGGALHEDGP